MSRRRQIALITALATVVLAFIAMAPGHHGSSAQASGSRQIDHPHAVDAVRRRATAERARALLGEVLSEAPAGSHWIASWGAAPEPASADSTLSLDGLDNQTVREIVMVSSNGAAVRIHLSNRYGDRPLVIGRASVAIAGSFGRLNAAPQELTFDGGSDSVTIPRGGTVVSDPIALKIYALQRLAISLYLPEETGSLTYHGTAEQLAFLGGGDQVANASSDWIGGRVTSWVLLTAVDTLSPRRYLGTVAAIGDSITAGYRSTLDTFGAWPDDLARRLALTPGKTLAVIDEGISGNRVLNGSPCCGPSGDTRFGPDVVDQAGVRAVILLEGTNDLGFSQEHGELTSPHTNVSAAQIIAGDERIIAEAHRAGLKIYGATLLPFKGADYWTPAAEQKREIINNWILTSGAFDGVIDFARVMAEPGHPQVMNPALNSGDRLHPNNAGYAAMAQAIDLAMLTDPSSAATDARNHSSRTSRASKHASD